MHNSQLHLPAQHHWRFLPHSYLNVAQKHWLTRPGALTQGLRQMGPLNIAVLGEYHSTLKSDEAYSMHLKPGSPIWVREIIMSLHGKPVVYARSLTHLNDSHSVWQRIRRLHTRPLADMLYHDSRIERSIFECTRLQRWQTLFRSLRQYQFIRHLAPPDANNSSLLARRSVFFKRQAPLMVNEVFLPEFWTILQTFPTVKQFSI